MLKPFTTATATGSAIFAALIEKLDYLQELGVTAIWLLPFYPSPLRDDGYDIADYYDVNPNYGTLEDFRAFLDAAHARGLRVITELVINHTSDQNPWFQKSRRAAPGSPERELYVWSDSPEKYKDARIIFKDFETSNWSWDPVAKAYYWHRFYSHQPDLNFDNPAVHEGSQKVLDFWLAMGVDGLRLDAVPYFMSAKERSAKICRETHAYLKKLRAHLDANFQDRMLLAEANQWPEDAVAYFGERRRVAHEFPFPAHAANVHGAANGGSVSDHRHPRSDAADSGQLPMGDVPAQSRRAHARDGDRRGARLHVARLRERSARRASISVSGADSRRYLATADAKSSCSTSCSSPCPARRSFTTATKSGWATIFISAIATAVRTPMQWSSDRNAGFSKANPQQLYLPITIDPEYHYEAVNVENQQKNLSSLLWWMRRVIAMRKNFKAFSRGSIEFLFPGKSKSAGLPASV